MLSKQELHSQKDSTFGMQSVVWATSYFSQYTAFDFSILLEYRVMDYSSNLCWISGCHTFYEYHIIEIVDILVR